MLARPDSGVLSFLLNYVGAGCFAPWFANYKVAILSQSASSRFVHACIYAISSGQKVAGSMRLIANADFEQLGYSSYSPMHLFTKASLTFQLVACCFSQFKMG